MGGLASWLTRRAAEHTKRSAVQSKNEFFKDFPRQNVYSAPDPGIGTKLPRRVKASLHPKMGRRGRTHNQPLRLVGIGHLLKKKRPQIERALAEWALIEWVLGDE